jgi:alpha-N-arabinofuranosidase
LRPVIRSPGYTNLRHGELPYLCASVVDDAATGQTAVFVLNRSLTDEMELSVTLRGLGSERALVQAEQLHSPDIHATNTADAPDRVAPQPLNGISIDGEHLRVMLKPASWNVIVTRAVRT